MLLPHLFFFSFLFFYSLFHVRTFIPLLSYSSPPCVQTTTPCGRICCRFYSFKQQTDPSASSSVFHHQLPHRQNPPQQFSFTAVRTRSNTLGSIANGRRRQTLGTFPRKTGGPSPLWLPKANQTCRRRSAAKCRQSGP